MKKLFLTISIFCLSFIAIQAQFSVKAGLNIAKGDFMIGSTNLASKPLYGFSAGVEGNFKIAGPLYINTGIMYQQKGTCTEFTIIETVKTNLLIEYIEVPLNLKVKLDLGPLSAFAYAGPYAAYAIGNTMSYDDSDKDDYHFDFGTDEDTMDRLDFGYNVGLGFGFSAIELMVNYGEGFGSIYNSPELISSSIKNKVLSISAAFKF